MDAILACIDGTGYDDDNEYAAAFENSFVNTIFKRTTASRKCYLRGPSDKLTGGMDTDDLAIKALAAINKVIAARIGAEY